jgi:hypothetical protein
LPDDITLKLYNPKDQWSYEERGSIRVRFVEQAAATVASSAIGAARDAMESGAVTNPGILGQPVSSDMPDVTGSVVTLSTVISKLAALANIVDAVSTVRKRRKQKMPSSQIYLHI